MNENRKKWIDRIPFLQKLKSIKHIEIYLAIIFALILIGIYFIDFSRTKTTATNASNNYSTYEYANYMENKLANVLSEVNGAGKVSVLISLESSAEIIYATTTEEKNNVSTITNSSTSNSTIKTEPVLVNDSGQSVPVIVKEYMPKINGIIVVAQGANDITVRLELLKAVQAIVNVPTTNIEILVGNK